MTLKYLLYSTCLLFLACNGSKYTPVDYPDDSIIFGYSGGIANMTTEFHLLSNGNLFKKVDKDNFESVKKVNNNDCDQLFNNVNFLDLENLQLSDPGNTTNFLRIKRTDKVHELAWGGNQRAPSAELAMFYSTLMNLVKKEK